MKKFAFIVVIILFCGHNNYAQLETQNWAFGIGAGITFSTNPPSALPNGSISALEGCASISDASGNYLFCSDGVNIWNRQNQVMANGGGLQAGATKSSMQQVLIVRKPMSQNLYFVFTLDEKGLSNGLRYNIVDMTLAAGMGSVVAKNVLLTTPSSERMTAVEHCNGTDVWLITHDHNSQNFRSFLIGSAGINTTAVISGVGSVFGNSGTDAMGSMKASPNGQKVVSTSFSTGKIELFDFDRSTGILSNSVIIGNVQSACYCEFSPDNSKVYVSQDFSNGSSSIGEIYQFDLCAGSDSLIVASKFQVSSSTKRKLGLQVGRDGKLYVSVLFQSYIGVINNPNIAGVGCGYVENVITFTSSTAWAGLPNFMVSYFDVPVSYSVANSQGADCKQSFTLQSAISSSCRNSQWNSVEWNYGEPSSGVLNGSTGNTGSHYYSFPGTYTVFALIHQNCKTDTVKYVLSVPFAALLSVSGSSVVCKDSQIILAALGANSYTWSNGANTGSIAVTPTATTVYTVVGQALSGACLAAGAIEIKVDQCTGINNYNRSFVSLIPNPAEDFCELTLAKSANSGNLQIQLITLDGKCLPVKTRKEETTVGIDLMGIEPGIYLVKICDSDGEVYYTRLIKN